MKYILLGHDTCGNLTAEVQKYLDKGWVIRGPAFADKHHLYQTMVKY